jgi:hypothetical protein
MDPVTIIGIIVAIITAAFKLWEAARQILGDKIPDWNTILQKNMTLQGKIDAEKERVANIVAAGEQPAESSGETIEGA